MLCCLQNFKFKHFGLVYKSLWVFWRCLNRGHVYVKMWVVLWLFRAGLSAAWSLIWECAYDLWEWPMWEFEKSVNKMEKKKKKSHFMVRCVRFIVFLLSLIMFCCESTPIYRAIHKVTYTRTHMWACTCTHQHSGIHRLLHPSAHRFTNALIFLCLKIYYKSCHKKTTG